MVEVDENSSYASPKTKVRCAAKGCRKKKVVGYFPTCATPECHVQWLTQVQLDAEVQRAYDAGVPVEKWRKQHAVEIQKQAAWRDGMLISLLKEQAEGGFRNSSSKVI